MLTELCQELKNWFIRSEDDVHSGEFTIQSGALSGVDFLLPNQYYRVQGSIFNDGVHRYGEDELTDETFSGTISGMAVPPAVIALSNEIDEWNEKNGLDKTASPYQSESWGGYSYSKGGGSANAAGTGGFGQTWQGTFASRLNRWRKV